MADSIRYIGPELAEAAAYFRSSIDFVNDEWSEMTVNVGQLEEEWQGEAATAFFNSYSQVDALKDRVVETITWIADTLDTVRREMEAVDEEIASAIPDSLG